MTNKLLAGLICVFLVSISATVAASEEDEALILETLEFIFSLDFVMAGESEGYLFNDITFLSNDVALVRSKLIRVNQQTSSVQLMPDRHINHLRVYERRSGQWLIVSHMISQAQLRT